MKIGFIGTGNMGNAIIGGILKKGIAKPSDIIGSSPDADLRKKTEDSFGIETTADNLEVIKKADIVFFSVKPQIIPLVAEEIKDSIRDDQLFISIVAGKTMEWFENAFGRKFKLVRTMPNTPALVGEGMTAAVIGELVTEEEKNKALEILGSFGQVEVVSEHIMDAVVAVSGSSPAYVFMLIDAMADGAVAEGMPRAQAYEFAAQAVLGSAKMVLETGRHPGELKDMVCSPAGTTIDAVKILEKNGFRAAVEEAMAACTEKAGKL